MRFGIVKIRVLLTATQGSRVASGARGYRPAAPPSARGSEPAR